jgi:hypothetical protein
MDLRGQLLGRGHPVPHLHRLQLKARRISFLQVSHPKNYPLYSEKMR